MNPITRLFKKKEKIIYPKSGLSASIYYTNEMIRLLKKRIEEDKQKEENLTYFG